ncbi:MAG TPA: hypothetical protein VJR50_18165 [Mycobacterium sp.]|nr:hypothetical protein [Mycobacterium sp.]
MSNISSDRIDDVAPGDVIAVDRGAGETQQAKVVFKDADESSRVYTITFEDDDGETFQKEFPSGTVVTRAMESKWESGQSPTPHDPDTPV